MASESEIVQGIRDLLKKSGHLNKLQAEVRTKVAEALQTRQASLCKGDDGKSTIPDPTGEVLLINELIREYLEWNGYLYTASILASEAAMPDDKYSRATLCSHVGVRDDEKSSALPLLSNIISAYTDRIKRKISKIKKDA